jgi:VanZ family protein
MSGSAIALPRPRASRMSEWLPIVIWAIVIFVFSTSGFSSVYTSRVLAPILRWIDPGISVVAIGIINALVRKLAHFTEYGVLFWLLVRGPLNGRPLVAMAVCVAYAMTDEAHQLFVPGRGPSIYDIALDSTGAMFGGFLRAAISEII